MGVIREDFLGSFMAKDSDGEGVELQVWVEVIDIGRVDKPGATMHGLKRLCQVDGGSVNRLSKGRYQVVQTGEQLTSDDPAAP